MTFEI